MKAPVLGRNEMHVLNENRRQWQPRLLSNVMNACLAGADIHAVASSAFRKNDKVKLLARPAKRLQLTNSSGNVGCTDAKISGNGASVVHELATGSYR